MELTTRKSVALIIGSLFMMSKIQNLNGTHNREGIHVFVKRLFMMSKIQNLNGTHNGQSTLDFLEVVVYDVKDTKFEWNSQLLWFAAISIARCL